MKYLADEFKLSMIKKENLEQSMNIKVISKYEVKKRLSDIDGYESLINDENSANTISQLLDISISCGKELTDFTPYDTLIVVQVDELSDMEELEDNSVKFMMLELNAMWKVDYYSVERELLEEITLGNLSYSEAKKEAFLAGVRIHYDVYDIYYIK